MSFTRDEVTAYEKQAPQQVSIPKATDESAPPAAETKQAPSAELDATEQATTTDDTSTSEVETDPAAPGEGDSSAENADSATATADDTDSEQEGASDGKHSARDRIQDLVAERNALRKYGEHVLASNEDLRRRIAALEAAPTTKVAAEPEPVAAETADPAPTMEAHQYDPVAYNKSLNEWIARQIDRGINKGLKSREQATAAENAKREATQVMEKFGERVTEFKKTHADFDMLVANPALPRLADVAARQVLMSEQGAAVTYHLAKNPDVAARIARMTPEQQLMAIGRLEIQVQTAPAAPKQPAQKKTTKAPPPPTPLPTGMAGQKSVGDMSMDEFVAHERGRKLKEKEDRARLRKMR